MRIAVVGLGKIGLPLAVFYAKNGHQVVGVDINRATVQLINQGQVPFPGERDLDSLLLEVRRKEMFTATSCYKESIQTADAIVVVVPVLIDANGIADLSNIMSATKEIAKYIREGTLVCFETTLPVGTTREKLLPLLAQADKGEDLHRIHVVFSPERVLSGRIFEDLRKYPKIVGGLFQCCSDYAKDFYSKVLSVSSSANASKGIEVWQVRDTDTAEFVKLAETIYRDVNIGLANEFSRYADKKGLNIYEVISAANSQNFSHIHDPGISVGGHCIPVYPHFYIGDNPDSDLVIAARKSNLMSPTYAINLLENELDSFSDKNILILGLSYRPNVKEFAFSGTLSLIESLNIKGARAFVYDVLYSPQELVALGFEVFDGNQRDIDAIIIHTDFDEIENFLTQFRTSTPIIDGRNCLSRNFKLSRHVITPGNLSKKTRVKDN